MLAKVTVKAGDAGSKRQHLYEGADRTGDPTLTNVVFPSTDVMLSV